MRARLVGGLRKLSLSRRMTRLQLSLRLGALTLVVLFAVLSTFGAKTFLLALQTTVVEVEFGERGGSWSAPTATLCLLDPEGAADRAPGGVCNPKGGFAAYRQLTLVDPLFAFGPGMGLEASVDADGRLALALLAWPISPPPEKGEAPRDAPTARADAGTGRSETLQEGARIYVEEEIWRRAGSFAFEGLMRAGALQSTGSPGLLLGGTWEARQSGLLAGSWITGATEVVKTEPLVRGGRAEVVRGDAPARVFGHFTYGADEAGPHIEAVALSASGATGLRVAHFGMDAPIVVRPDLIDIAISSPLLLALAVVLSLLASATQVYADLVDRLRKPRADDTAP